MNWNFEEALAYYRQQGAPGDQAALISFLREIQQEAGGRIPVQAIGQIAADYKVKESYLLAVVKRIPSLQLANTHTLELCGGPNCSRRAELAAFVEKTYGTKPQAFTLQFSGCMRMCGKGPNIKWDGKLYHGADEALISKLVSGIEP